MKQRSGVLKLQREASKQERRLMSEVKKDGKKGKQNRKKGKLSKEEALVEALLAGADPDSLPDPEA